MNVLHGSTTRSRLVCLGDSITHGDTGQGFNAPHPWPEQIGMMLGVEVVNCGHDGASTKDYTMFPEWTTAQRNLPGAALITVGLGTNDIDIEQARDDEELSAVVDRLHALIETAAAIAGDPQVAILSVPQMAVTPPILPRFNREELDRINASVAILNDKYMQLCEECGWAFIDYASAFNQRRELYGNTIHPNQAGYDLLSVVMARQLAALLR